MVGSHLWGHTESDATEVTAAAALSNSGAHRLPKAMLVASIYVINI